MEKLTRGFSFLSLILICTTGLAQKTPRKESPGGRFSLGARSTLSTFNDNHDESVGRGVGGQFRIQLSDRVNTEWFADYLNSNIGTYARRSDYHIGWSVLYYFVPASSPKKLQPYALAGHCFDFTRIHETAENGVGASRWSSAVQAGLGTHYRFSPRMDVSLNAQYMIHLGKQLDAHLMDDHLHIENDHSHGLEGHLLFTLSFNYQIGDLW